MTNEKPATEKGRPLKDETTILVSGRAFSGWEQVSITKNLESIANTFSIKLFDKFTGLRSSWPLKAGVSIKINIGQTRVFTGRIEMLTSEFTDESRSFTISGRSLAGDLIDCMHVGPSEYKNLTLLKLAEELVKPFGLKVFESIKTTIIDKFAVKPGETIFESLDRAARAQGLFFISTAGGNIRITRAGADEGRFRSFTTLAQDINLLSASGTFDDSKRHNEYIFKGQASGLPSFNGEKSTAAEGTAKDLGVSRHRPLIMIAEGNADSAKAKLRAEWEASSRLAKATRIRASVAGWTQDNGQLWGVNQLIHFHSTFVGLNQDLLSLTVSHTQAVDAGKTTSFILTDKNAYLPEPEKNKKKKDDIFTSLGKDFTNQ